MAEADPGHEGEAKIIMRIIKNDPQAFFFCRDWLPWAIPDGPEWDTRAWHRRARCIIACLRERGNQLGDATLIGAVASSMARNNNERALHGTASTGDPQAAVLATEAQRIRQVRDMCTPVEQDAIDQMASNLTTHMENLRLHAGPGTALVHTATRFSDHTARP